MIKSSAIPGKVALNWANLGFLIFSNFETFDFSVARFSFLDLERFSFASLELLWVLLLDDSSCLLSLSFLPFCFSSFQDLDTDLELDLFSFFFLDLNESSIISLDLFCFEGFLSPGDLLLLLLLLCFFSLVFCLWLFLLRDCLATFCSESLEFLRSG